MNKTIDLNGIIEYTRPDGFRMAEEFSGDASILEDVIKEMREEGNTEIVLRMYDEE